MSQASNALASAHVDFAVLGLRKDPSWAILYEFTVDDSTSWTSPWSAEIPMVKTEGPIFEYACHEDNYHVRHFLESWLFT